ncbi:hypothetical protein [Streptomyces sp. NPDC021020]|uniref:hypothetical protein n=1 Tax=Streptomyces sp. NPDC021020 TaxID=3365109 RepID=UPI0037B655B5
MAGSRLRSHDDVQLVVPPLRVLAPVFLRDLVEAAERWPWVVLFFDVFERTEELLNQWLPDVLVGKEYGALPLNVIAVLSGQGRLAARRWGEHRSLVRDVPLEVFTEDETRELLAVHGITDEQVIEVVMQLAGQPPVLTDLLTQTRPEDPTAVEDPADTAVDRFLKWITGRLPSLTPGHNRGGGARPWAQGMSPSASQTHDRARVRWPQDKGPGQAGHSGRTRRGRGTVGVPAVAGPVLPLPEPAVAFERAARLRLVLRLEGPYRIALVTRAVRLNDRRLHPGAIDGGEENDGGHRQQPLDTPHGRNRERDSP